MNRSTRLLLLLVLLVTPSFLLLAQNTTGSITGRLTEASGAIVPSVGVTVRNLGTGVSREVQSDESGTFTATLLLPGKYEVTAKKDGFRTEVQSGITLDVAQVVRTDFTLTVGSTNETVEVNADAVTLDTDSAAIAQVVDQKQVNELPLNGRNFVNLLLLEPGAVQTSGEQAQSRFGVGDAISIGGGVSASNSYTVDGTTITDTAYATPAFAISVEAVQQFKEQTKNYSAEYGFGANQINLSTRSGSNTVHGSVFEFLRNDFLDAHTYFNRLPNKIARLRQSQFGYSLGLPVVIPHLYNGRDRTFFFANYEGQRIRTQRTILGNTPTTDQLNGIFDVASINPVNPNARIIDPYTRQPFPRNASGAYVIPPSRFSRLGKIAAARFFPAPNTPGTSNYTANLSSPLDADQQTYRLDQVITPKDSAFFRGTIASLTTTQPSNLTNYSNLGYIQISRNYQLTETHIFTPNLLNQLRIGYLEAQALRRGVTITTDDASTLGLQNIFQLQNAPYPTITLTATGAPGNNATGAYTAAGGQANTPTGSNQPTWDLSDSVSWNHGKHTVGFGFNYRALQLNRQSTVSPYGQFTFDGSATGNQIADMLLGTYFKVVVPQPGPVSDLAKGNDIHLHFKAWAPYIQDDWKVSKSLTLNLGFRYDFTTTPNEEQNHLAWFNPSVPGGGLYVANQSVVQTYGGGIYTYNGQRGPGPAQKNVLSPRFGFAFRPFDNGNTVIRGGYGIFYDSFQTNEFVSSTAIYPFAPVVTYQSAPNASSPVINNSDTGFSPLAVSAVTPAALSFLQIAATQRLTPYVQDWSLGIQRQLTSAASAEVSYVGNKATHLLIRYNPNQPSICNATTNCNPLNQNTNSINARRPYKNIGQMVYEGFDGYSNYNALNLKLQYRSKDVTVIAGYAYSKMLDIKSAAAAVSGDAFGAYGPQDSHCLPCDYGRASYDVGQRFVMSALYNLPFGTGQRFAATGPSGLRALYSGWQANIIYTIQGGFPFSVTATDLGSANEAFAERANQVGNPYPGNGFVKGPNSWFSKAAFSQPAPGYFGNSSRNVLRGPGINNIDASLFKNTQIERVNLQLRLESFNAMNHPEFGLPNASVTNQSTLGTITSINGFISARQNQVALKLVF